jgi:hypothetical protein
LQIVDPLPPLQVSNPVPPKMLTFFPHESRKLPEESNFWIRSLPASAT